MVCTEHFQQPGQVFDLPVKQSNKNWAASCIRCGPVFLFAAHILLWERVFVPRKNRKPGVWDDLDSRLDATDKLARDFFSDAQAITSIGYTPTSQIELSDEELSEPLVSVRFDAEGNAEQVFAEELDAKVTDTLEPMPVPEKLGVTEWGSTFAEIHARVEEMSSVSLPKAIRYDARGVGLKVSSLPSAVDFCADVCVIARRVLTPALYRVWNEIYYQGFGTEAHRVPEAVQSTIMQLCGTAWKQFGLWPFGGYWKIRVDLERMRVGTVKNVVDARDERNARRRAARAKKARRAAEKLAAAA